MMEYLEVYIKTVMCENILLFSGFQRGQAHVLWK